MEHINSRELVWTYMTDKVKGKTKDENQVFLFRVKKKTIFARHENVKITASMKTQQFKRREPKVYPKIYGRVLKYLKSSSSEEEHMENALALGAEEGRDKLRKAAGSCK